MRNIGGTRYPQNLVSGGVHRFYRFGHLIGHSKPAPILALSKNCPIYISIFNYMYIYKSIFMCVRFSALDFCFVSFGFSLPEKSYILRTVFRFTRTSTRFSVSDWVSNTSKSTDSFGHFVRLGVAIPPKSYKQRRADAKTHARVRGYAA